MELSKFKLIYIQVFKSIVVGKSSDSNLCSWEHLTANRIASIFYIPAAQRTIMVSTMDKLKLTGWNLGRVFNSRLGCAWMCHSIAYITKQSNVKLKTSPKQFLGSLP